MPVLLQTTLLLICSNLFMTFAWYAHLKDMSGRRRLWSPQCGMGGCAGLG